MITSFLRPAITALPDARPFIPAEAIERESGRALDIIVGANENGFGPSDFVIKCMAEATQKMWRYPDAESYDLRQALAQHHNIGQEKIVIGNGIDGLLGNICRLCLDPTDLAVTSSGAYPTFNYHIAAVGAQYIACPYDDYHEDLTALSIAAQTHRPKIVYLSNPDNPMGTWHSAKDIINFHGAIPPECLLILDEAYIEMAPKGTAPDLDWLPDNVIRLRTFSKAYGLAGLRVGYGLAQAPLIRAFEKTRDHFGVGNINQVGAIAAVQDQAHMLSVLTKIEDSRNRIAKHSTNLGAEPIASATNFVTVDFKIGTEKSNLLLQNLTQDGVFIRKPMTPGLDHTIRISTAPADQIDVLFERVKRALEALS